MNQRLMPGSAAARCAGCAFDTERRASLKAIAAFALATCGMGSKALAASDGPQKGDWLVAVDAEGVPLRSDDLKVGDKQRVAVPFDPATKRVRNASRLNRIILIKLDPNAMDAPTRQRAADGVLAYSAVCTHQSCDVSAWRADKQVFLCYCHFSQFAPLEQGAVLEGPAPRPLPALPLALEEGRLVIAGDFTARPGPQS
jgi:rieske iron-sulfur protein